MAGQEAQQQPITITNQQGQQITVIPAHQINQIRPSVSAAAGANIIQMPSMSGIHQFPIQNIPGLGNVQVSWHLFFILLHFLLFTFYKIEYNLQWCERRTHV